MGQKLYVRNLDELMDQDTLEEMFGSVGNVLSASIEMKTIREKVYKVGYVTMSSHQEALDGIERFHNFKTKVGLLVVTEDIPHVPVQIVKTPKNQLFYMKKHPQTK